MPTKAIVIVEDDATIAAVIKDVLGTVPDYTAATVGNGAEALSLVAQLKTDLLILDYGLPGLSGIEVYDQLRERLGDAMPPVLFLSATLPFQELSARGLTDYLEKPFDVDTLLQRVAALLGD